MNRHPASTAAFLVILLLTTFAVAAQAAGAPAAPARTPALAGSAIAASPAVVALPSTAQPAWDPSILAGLAPEPAAARDNPLSQIANPSFCPPPCIACIAPRHCGGPCQVNMGCTICRCT